MTTTVTDTAPKPAATSRRRYAGPVVFAGLALIVGVAGFLIWSLAQREKPTTPPSVSEEMEPGDWSWADGEKAGGDGSSDSR